MNGLAVRKDRSFTSYAGITRIRFKGKRAVTAPHLSRSSLQHPCVQFSAVRWNYREKCLFCQYICRISVPFVQNGDDLRKGIVVAVRHNGSAAASHGFYAVSRGKPLCRHRQHGEIVVFVSSAVDMIHGDPQALCQTSYHSSLAGALPGDIQQSPIGEKHLIVR